MGLRWLVALVLVGLAALAAVGCGEDGENGALDKETQRLLEQMVLTTEELPPGLERVSASYSTNADVAGELIGAEGTLAKLEEWGRRLGYDVQFEPGPDASVEEPVKGVHNTASLYRTAEGASDSLADGIRTSRGTDWSQLYLGVSELQVQEVSRVSLGDEGVWFRISGFDEEGHLVVDDQVAFRVGPVRAFLRMATVFRQEQDRDAYVDQVEAWVGLLTGRIQQVLSTLGAGAASGP